MPNLDIAKVLEKMARDIEQVKENSTSEKNIGTLDKVEKAIDKLSGFLETFSLPQRGPKQEEKEAVIPETPDVDLPDTPSFFYVRRRGGKVVKRQVGK